MNTLSEVKKRIEADIKLTRGIAWHIEIIIKKADLAEYRDVFTTIMGDYQLESLPKRTITNKGEAFDFEKVIAPLGINPYLNTEENRPFLSGLLEQLDSEWQRYLQAKAQFITAAKKS